MQKNQLPKETLDFLKGTSSKEEDARVIAWYDQLDFTQQNNDELVNQISSRSKEKIFQKIGKEKNRASIYSWSRLVAAAVLLIVGFFAWKTISRSNNLSQDATESQLAMIKPARERAIITLETGEEINLDNLKINESIQIGDITVVKNSQGQISYINSKTGEPQMNSIRIPKASIYTVTLSDGSKVTLNSESKLTYPSVFKNGDRTVVLEGEGYFEIEHTPNKDRFIVQTEQQEVEVLGTKFNIKAFDRENTTFTTLASGSVKVNSRSKPEHQVIKPGQQAYSARNGSLAIQAVDLEKVLGWTNGQFIFDGTNNKETFDEIARWYDVDIQHQANSRNNEYIGKIPRHLTLDKLISLMNYAEIDIQARIDKNNRIKLLIN